MKHQRPFPSALFLALVGGVLLSQASASCASASQVANPPDEDSERVEVGGFWGFFPSPDTFGDEGVGATLGLGLWRSDRHDFIQLRAGLEGRLGFGFQTEHTYLAVMPTAGFDIFPWSPVGIEVEFGLGLQARLGAESNLGVGIFGKGGYVFRLGDDVREQFKLFFTFESVGYFAAEVPESDIFPAGVGLGMSFETPF